MAAVNNGKLDTTYTIENKGKGGLDLEGNPKVEITGTHAEDFTITARPSSPVAANGGIPTFDDVPLDYWAYEILEIFYQLGIWGAAARTCSCTANLTL